MIMEDQDNDPNVRLLREISERRDKLLREMYHMLRLRENVGTIFKINEEDEQELPNFLDKYDLTKNPDTGSIATLPENELFLPPSPLSSPSANDPEVPAESDDELDLIAPSVRSTRPSPALPPTSAGSLVEPPDQPKDVQTEVTLTHPSPPATEVQPKSNKEDDREAELEPEDEEVVVEEMVVDKDEVFTPDERNETAEPAVEEEVVPDSSSALPPQEDDDKMVVDEVAPPEDLGSVVLPKEDEPKEDEPREDEPKEDEPVEPVNEVPIDEVAIEENDTLPEARDQTDDMVVDQDEPVPQTSSGSPPPASDLDEPSTPPTLPVVLTFAPATPRHEPIVIPAPAEPLRSFSTFDFDSSSEGFAVTPATIDPIRTLFNPEYTLPPLKLLPVEFNRKSRPSKLQRKKEKELQKELKAEGDKKSKEKDKEKDKDDFVPLGAMRWGITVRVNPVYKRLHKAAKCLTTRDWTVGMTELKLIRTLERIDFLKDGRWSFRQPKKQRGLGQATKTHWDYLLEEMKWMRTDFREERKWKLSLAFTLSTAVLDWHAAGSWEERIAKGICVKWKPPTERDDPPMEEVMLPDGGENMEVDGNADSQKTSMSLGGYGSDDDDDDDQDKQSAIDPLDAATLLDDALQANEQKDDEIKELKPKTEEVDDSSALQDTPAMDVDMDGGAPNFEIKAASIADEPSLQQASAPAAKSSSQSSAGDAVPPMSKSKSSKIMLYAPLRDRIVYSDVDKHFIDLDDFRLPDDGEPSSLEHPSSHLPPADLTSIFPDLQPFALYEPSSTLPSDSKRKSEKKLLEEWKTRIDETERTKIWPVGKYMQTKPTVVSALQPAQNWKDGQWASMEDGMPILDDSHVLSVKLPDDCSNALFDSKPHATAPVFRDRKISHHLWSLAEDNLLKSFIDRFGGNWTLICEMFNGHNPTISLDKRTPRECYERWKEKWAPPELSKPKASDSSSVSEEIQTPPPSQPPATPQMTTRGVKRLASVSVSSPTSNNATAMGTEPKKRRRHLIVQQSIRQAVKKRAEEKQKQNPKKSSTTHETHIAFTKMPKLTPAELSRMKTEKENQEMMAKKQAQAQAYKAMQAQAQALQQQQAQQQQPNTQPQPQQPQQNTNPGQPMPIAQTNSVPRPPGVVLPVQATVPQIRSQQVNISQQPRMAAPLIAAQSRLSPQQQTQLLQARAAQQLQAQGQPLSQQALSHMIAQAQQVAQAQQAAHAQAQAAAQNPGVGNGNGVTPGAHMSPQSYISRDATSSPHAHTSPPRSSATPSNAINSPRPPSAQAQHTPQMAQAQLQAVQQAVQAQLQNNRAAAAMTNYYLTGNYTQDQVQNALRLQALQQQIHQQQQLQSQPNQNQQPTNSSFQTG